MTDPLLQRHPNGVATVDTQLLHRPGLAAAHLIEEGGRAAFVDTGTGWAVPHLLGALEASGIPREAVDYVLVTHVHLDHAGGAGALLRELPGARLVVHPRGARHMVDPSKLVAGATAVYGEGEMHDNFGEVVPVPAGRVIEAEDGTTVELAGRPLTCLDTPGHARHHFAVWDPASRGLFTGDTFGLSYREFDSRRGPFVLPTTTPVQFDPEALHRSLDRLADLAPADLYLTHFGRIPYQERLLEDMHRLTDAFAGLARRYADRGAARHALIKEAMADLLLEALAEHGSRVLGEAARERLEMDLELNAQGLVVWLERG
jgi:glyoxylase-like metal-dependent hydrolase (beta-lactamase superfamily II)